MIFNFQILIFLFSIKMPARTNEIKSLIQLEYNENEHDEIINNDIHNDFNDIPEEIINELEPFHDDDFIPIAEEILNYFINDDEDDTDELYQHQYLNIIKTLKGEDIEDYDNDNDCDEFENLGFELKSMRTNDNNHYIIFYYIYEDDLPIRLFKIETTFELYDKYCTAPYFGRVDNIIYNYLFEY